MKLINDETVKIFFQHPSAKNIMRWFRPFVPSSELTDEENYLNFLKYIMITGQQDEFMEKLSEPHALKTSLGNLDFNQISQNGKKVTVTPDIQFIEDNNLRQEALWRYDVNRRMNRLIIYLDTNGKNRYEWIDGPADYKHWPSVVYKKIWGILYVPYKGEVEYVNTSSGIANLIASKTPMSQLINANNL